MIHDLRRRSMRTVSSSPDAWPPPLTRPRLIWTITIRWMNTAAWALMSALTLPQILGPTPTPGAWFLFVVGSALFLLSVPLSIWLTRRLLRRWRAGMECH